MWEATAGGSALQGENPLDCAVRELREETGISSDRLTEIGRVFHYGHRTIYVEYLCNTAIDKSSIVLQDGENSAYKKSDLVVSLPPLTESIIFIADRKNYRSNNFSNKP